MDQPPSETTRLLDRILAAIISIRYGSVQIVIQDAKVIQIEKIERVRLYKTNKADQTTGGHPQQIARTDQITGGEGPLEGIHEK